MKNKSASQNGRRNRQKGQEFEREVVAMLEESAVAAERIKGSGYQAKDHNDIRITEKSLTGLEIECKRKSKGWAGLYKLMEQKDVSIVALRADNKPALAVIEFKFLCSLLYAFKDEMNGLE